MRWSTKGPIMTWLRRNWCFYYDDFFLYPLVVFGGPRANVLSPVAVMRLFLSTRD